MVVLCLTHTVKDSQPKLFVLLARRRGETDELVPQNRLVLETQLRCYEKYELS